METPEAPRPVPHDGERGDQPVGEDSPQQQRARRIAALSALAAAPAAPGSEDPCQLPRDLVQAARRPHWRRRARVGLAVVVLLGVVAAVVLKLHPLTTPTGAVSRPKGPVQLLPNADGGMNCTSDMAFAPHGHRLAMLGFEYPCFGSASVASDFNTGSVGSASASAKEAPGLVSLYDTQRGALLGQFHPSALIKPQLPQPSAAVLAALDAAGIQPDFLDGINYTHLLWSPDGQRLAITFQTFVTAGLPNTPTIPGQAFDGVLLTDAAGANPQVLVHPINRVRPAATLWDLGSGTALPVPADLAPPSAFASVPPARSYTWASDGALHAQAPFPPTPVPSAAPPAAPLDPVGTPEGGATFTPWQAGEVANGSASRPGPAHLVGASAFAMDTAAWSPDGRFLAQRVGLMGLLVSPQSPTPDAATLAASQWAQAPRLPVRDAGLQQAVAVAGTNSFLSVQGVLVAWRPDGKLIAVDADRPDHAVILFDCTTGQPVATLMPPLQGRGGNLIQGFINMLRWSPDGSQLALYDTTVGILTIWSGAQLPR